MLPEINTEAMNLHLAEISRCVAPSTHAVVNLDGAGWHKMGDRLEVPDNISLLPLPRYSPELNPVENIWEFLRQNYLATAASTSKRWPVPATRYGPRPIIATTRGSCGGCTNRPCSPRTKGSSWNVWTLGRGMIAWSRRWKI